MLEMRPRTEIAQKRHAMQTDVDSPLGAAQKGDRLIGLFGVTPNIPTVGILGLFNVFDALSCLPPASKRLGV